MSQPEEVNNQNENSEIQTEESSQQETQLQEEAENPTDAEPSLEDQARELGWKPKDEANLPEGFFKEAGAFLKDKEIYDTARANAKELKDVRSTLNDLKSYMSKSEEAGYKRALKELEQQQKIAVQNMDEAALEQIVQERIQVQQQMNQVVDQTPQKQAEEIQFEERNKDWYNRNTEENGDMSDFAINMSAMINAKQPDLSLDQHMQKVEQAVKKAYPHRFRNQKRSEPSLVDAGTGSKSQKSSIDKSKVPAHVLRTGEKFVRENIFGSIDEYLKDCKSKGLI
jgi:hypothetical protein